MTVYVTILFVVILLAHLSMYYVITKKMLDTVNRLAAFKKSTSLEEYVYLENERKLHEQQLKQDLGATEEEEVDLSNVSESFTQNLRNNI